MTCKIRDMEGRGSGWAQSSWVVVPTSATSSSTATGQSPPVRTYIYIQPYTHIYTYTLSTSCPSPVTTYGAGRKISNMILWNLQAPWYLLCKDDHEINIFFDLDRNKQTFAVLWSGDVLCIYLTVHLKPPMTKKISLWENMTGGGANTGEPKLCFWRGWVSASARSWKRQ